jgi:HEAT repeat protein
VFSRICDQADYAKGATSKAEFLEAIACLGAMGSTEAAQALALYLQFINAQTEQGSPFDEDVLLASIRALGELGDKAAFDYLLQIGYLQYTEAVKRAAKDALLKLKW